MYGPPLRYDDVSPSPIIFFVSEKQICSKKGFKNFPRKLNYFRNKCLNKLLVIMCMCGDGVDLDRVFKESFNLDSSLLKMGGCRAQR